MSAAPSPIDELVRSIVAEGLLSEISLRDCLASASPPPDSIPKLVSHLVSQGKLTPFQGKSLEAGNLGSLILGNYAILDRIGGGGMGEVFRAKHRRMGRVVALKIMTAESTFGPLAADRFDREVRAAARLSHPNIVTAFDSDEAGGRLFLVMEYLEGSDLDTCLRTRGRFDPGQSAEIILQAARGLEYAHQQGVIHRDIKPSNLLLTADGVVKLMDLGLARLEEPSENSQSTAPDVVFGTPDFMAPEQCLGAKYADHRSDIYSLGCTWYTIVTGSVIFEGENKVQKILAHREFAIPSLLPAGASEAMEAIFRRMVAKWPDERFQSTSELVAALAAITGVDHGNSTGLAGLAKFTAIDAAAPTVKRNGQATPSYPLPKPADAPTALPPGLLRPRPVVGPGSPATAPTQPAIATAALAPSRARWSRRSVLMGIAGLAGLVCAGTWFLRARRGPPIDMLQHLAGAPLTEGWTLTNSVLLSPEIDFRPDREFPSQAASILEISPLPWGDTELEMVVEHVGGRGPLIVGIPTMAGWATFVADRADAPDEKGKGPPKGVAEEKSLPPRGVPALGPPGGGPPPRRPPDVPLEGPTRVMAIVRDGGTVLECNGQLVAQLPWDPMSGVTHRVHSKALFLAALGQYRISRLVVRHLIPPGFGPPAGMHKKFE